MTRLTAAQVRMRAWLRRLWATVHKGPHEQELQDELMLHVEFAKEDLQRRQEGASHDAVRAARIRVGGLAQAMEALRDQRTLPWLDALLRDVRAGLRALRRTPGFTLVVVAILSIAVGANSAVFTLVERLLLSPPPYPEPGRLGTIVRHFERHGLTEDSPNQDGRIWFGLREQLTGIDFAIAGGASGVNLVANGRAEYVQQQRVSAGFFHVLGVAPAVGREFQPDEDRLGGPAVVVLSHQLWLHVFEADSGIVGRRVTLRGEPFTVVGVMPPSFRSNVPADLWTPIRPSIQGEGGGSNYFIVARLQTGVAWRDAEARVAAIGGVLLTERYHPPPDLRLTMRLVPLQRTLTSRLRQPLFVLWAAVAIVLLIGCANIAGLLLVRGAARMPEVATRMALGAGRGAIVRQVLVESLLLALMGGLAGGVLGFFACRIASAYLVPVLSTPVAPDVRILASAMGMALLTSLVFAVLPALFMSRPDVRAMLLEGGSVSIAGKARHWPARAIVVAEVALGIVLVVGAGLLIRSVDYLAELPTGFSRVSAVAGAASLQDARYQTNAQITELFDRSVEQMRRVPGVQGAAVALSLPYQRAMNQGWRFDQQSSLTAEAVNWTYVTPDYFSVLGIPLLSGRTFTVRDLINAPRVVLVNETFRRRYSPDASPTGRFMQFGTGPNQPQYEIVGVVAATQQQNSGLRGYRDPVAALPGVYVPAAQVDDGSFRLAHTWFEPQWIIRTSAPASVVIPQMRSVLRNIDPALPFNAFRTLDELRDAALVAQRVEAMLLGALAALALTLAMLGVYGLVAHSVVGRRRELGIRFALGATARQILATAVRPGLVLTAFGVLIGLVLAYAAAHLIQGLVFGVTVTDAWTFGGAAIVVLLAAGLASVLPAMRTLQLNQAAVLRQW